MADINLMDRILPHSVEAEQAVLGSALQSGDSVATAAEIVKPEDFFTAQNREIYGAMIDLFNENIPIDIVTISDRLQQNDKLDTTGGIAYLTMLTANAPTTGNTEYYARIIKNKAVLRRLINAAGSITEMGYEGREEVDLILEQSEELLFGVSSSKEQRDIQPVGDILMTAYEDMVAAAQAKGKITGISTGYTELDRRTGGFRGGELIIIAGRPGMGKSSFAVNIAENASIGDKVTIAIFNLEMSRTMIVNRILCSQALVDSYAFRSGDFTGEDWLQIGKVVDRVAEAPIYIDDTASVTVSEIRAKCRRLKQTKNLGLIVIDYLQLMQSGKGRSGDNRQQEISDISRSLKILAKELDVPVIALSQLARSVEARSDKRPMLSDLRESGAIEQDADLVMFLYRDDYYNKNSEEKNVAECIIAKQRNGETGMFKLGWQGKYTKFVNIEYKAVEK